MQIRRCIVDRKMLQFRDSNYTISCRFCVWQMQDEHCLPELVITVKFSVGGSMLTSLFANLWSGAVFTGLREPLQKHFILKCILFGVKTPSNTFEWTQMPTAMPDGSPKLLNVLLGFPACHKLKLWDCRTGWPLSLIISFKRVGRENLLIVPPVSIVSEFDWVFFEGWSGTVDAINPAKPF